MEKSVDYFVDVKGDFERTCFGMSLEELVQITDPVSKIPLPAANPESFLPANASERNSLKVSSGNDSAKLSVPKELWRLIDAIWSGNALKEKDLFSMASADPNEVAMIRLALDRGVDFSPCAPHAVVEVLVSFLAALPRPLLPYDLYPTVSARSE